ncbi:MAG: tripartite tricarboxylate transporter substrate binding protein [Burkholderiales bacterium]|nr:tripartite tricarboxylate transporter substrate binding protein [Burkholderiales bacterium]
MRIKMPYLLTALATLGCVVQVSVLAADAAGNFPSRPIRLIVPQNPGASNDTISRIVAIKMGELLGQQMVIDNRPGAGGTIGGELAATASPDGHTLYATATASQVIGPQIIKNIKYHPTRDFAPISVFAITDNVLVVNPRLPVKSLKELIAHAKAHPGKLNFANAGPGTQSHLAGVLLAHATGIDVVQVPYKGGGASVAATIAGESPVTITPAPAVLGHVQAGRLRALASGSAKRSPLTPELPTLIESGLPGFVSNGWIGLLAPRATPRPVVNKLHAALVQAVKDPATARNMEKAGGDPETGTPAEFLKLIENDWKNFGEAIRIAKLKAE